MLQGDGFALQVQAVLARVQRFDLIEHFAFEAFEVFQRDIQKVATAAGRVQGAFEQGAKNGGPDFGPIGFGGFEQAVDLVAIQGQGVAIGL